LQRLNYASPDILDMSKDELIQSLQIDVMKLNDEIANLQETINNLQKPRNNYNIVNNIQELLLETEGKEQQELIIERLQAVYRMNRNIKL
jgi:septal ring factor EnvC (AmiA/AmiB activator)